MEVHEQLNAISNVLTTIIHGIIFPWYLVFLGATIVLHVVFVKAPHFLLTKLMLLVGVNFEMAQQLTIAGWKSNITNRFSGLLTFIFGLTWTTVSLLQAIFGKRKGSGKYLVKRGNSAPSISAAGIMVRDPRRKPITQYRPKLQQQEPQTEESEKSVKGVSGAIALSSNHAFVPKPKLIAAPQVVNRLTGVNATDVSPADNLDTSTPQIGRPDASGEATVDSIKPLGYFLSQILAKSQENGSPQLSDTTVKFMQKVVNYSSSASGTSANQVDSTNGPADMKLIDSLRLLRAHEQRSLLAAAAGANRDAATEQGAAANLATRTGATATPSVAPPGTAAAYSFNPLAASPGHHITDYYSGFSRHQAVDSYQPMRGKDRDGRMVPGLDATAALNEPAWNFLPTSRDSPAARTTSRPGDIHQPVAAPSSRQGLVNAAARIRPTVQRPRAASTTAALDTLVETSEKDSIQETKSSTNYERDGKTVRPQIARSNRAAELRRRKQQETKDGGDIMGAKARGDTKPLNPNRRPLSAPRQQSRR